MHQIAFDAKRAHLRTLAWGQRVLECIPGMTGARFDLLYLLRQKALLPDHFDFHRDALSVGILQRELCERLDIHRSTLSEMLIRLEEMGWIRRTRATRRGEWRTKMVFFTALGLRHMAKAMRVMFRQRSMLRYFERIYKDGAPGAWPHRKRHIVETLERAREHVKFIAEAFGDRSMVNYDFGPPPSRFISDFYDSRWRPFHPLYLAPPKPKRPPVPLAGAARQPCRPFGYTEYENNIRDIIWNTEKKRRRKAS